MKNSRNICVVVLDGVGIGAMPDAHAFGDTGAHTLGNIAARVGGLHLPNLYQMGLGNITDSRLPSVSHPTAAYGRLATQNKAKDTTAGHWELAGLVLDPPFHTYPSGFPVAFLREWASENNLPGYLGNEVASGTEIMDRLGAAHMETGRPIVYTSADSVFQIAAHEKVIPLPRLYALCEAARQKLNDGYRVGRVIARPFLGEAGVFARTKNRRDYAVPPTGPIILDSLRTHGVHTTGIGKISDIFCGQGLDATLPAKGNAACIAETIVQMGVREGRRFIFTNLVDFDSLYGHRNDAHGFAAALEYFDTQLPRLLAALGPDDVLMLTADHGCDPTTTSTDHSREYVPCLVYGATIPAKNLHTRGSLADVGATVHQMLTGKNWPVGWGIS